MATPYQLIDTAAELRAACDALSRFDAVGFDCETTALDPYAGRLRLVQLAGPEGPAHLFDLFRLAPGGDAAKVESLEPLRRLLAAQRPVKVAHNAKFDAKWTRRHLGVELGGLFDTMLASQLVSAGETEDRHGLATVAARYLDEDVDKTQQLSDWGGELSDAQLEYAARDAALMLPLRERLIERLKSDGLVRVAQIEFECVGAVAALELAGLYLDAARWREQIEKVKKERAVLAEELQAMLAEGSSQGSLFANARADINLDSHAQLSAALKRMGVPLPDSTRNWKLQPLAKDYPVIAKLLDYRTVQKSLTSYGENILEEINPVTGRIHASFHQIGAPTGRFACLAGDTLVPTPAGFKRMRDLREGDSVKTSYGFRRVEKAWATGVRRLYRVRLHDGRSLRATADHRFLTGRADTWKQLDELRPGDPLYVSLRPTEVGRDDEPLRIDVPTPEVRSRKAVRLPAELSPALCELMGLITADGFLGRRHERPATRRGRVRGTPAVYDRVLMACGWHDDELIERINEHAHRLFGQPFGQVKSRTCRVLQLASTRVAHFLAALGLEGDAHTKSVPEVVLRAPAIFQAAFLRGLFAGDGCRVKNSVKLTSVNFGLLGQSQLMLSNLGIYSSISRRRDATGFAGSSRYDLKIHGKANITRFMEAVGFVSAGKNRPFAFTSQITDGARTPFVIPGARLYREAVAAGVTPASRVGVKPFTTFYKGTRIKDESVRRLIVRFGMLPSLRPVSAYLDLHVRPVEIESITPDAAEEVYDITVEGVHEFVADGIVVHNCTNPNVQQIPHAPEYRRCVRAQGPNRKLIIADYCVAGGTRVATERGLVPIEQVRPGDAVCLEDGGAAQVAAVISRGRLPVVRLSLRNGYSLTATALHRVRVLDAAGDYVWRRIGELRESDRVAVQPGRGARRGGGYVRLPPAVSAHHNNRRELTTPNSADERLAAFLGYLTGDGSLRPNALLWVVNQQDADAERRLRCWAAEMFGLEVHERGAYRGVFEAGIYSTPLAAWCESLGVGKDRVPEFVWTSPPPVVAAFLRGLFEADGSVTDGETGKVSFATSRQRLAAEVQQLLLTLGVPSTLRRQDNAGPGKRFSCWAVSVLAAGLSPFAERIGFLSARKRGKMAALAARWTGKTVAGNMPNLQAKARALAVSGEARRLLNNTLSLGRPVGASLALRLEQLAPEAAEGLGLERLTRYKQLFLPVVSVEQAGEAEVFDLSVPGPMTYISDGFVSHNSQIELRILAHVTEDKGFIEAFNSGADLHRVTAAQIFNTTEDGVTKEQRDFAKRLNFGVVYGIGAQRFSMMTGLPLADAEAIMARYFQTYRGLDAWLREAARKALRERQARTMAGRLARFNFDPEDRQAASLAQRNGKNMPVQGASADILKRALRLLHDRLRGTSGEIVNIVHDEVLVECDATEAESAAEAVEKSMCEAGEEFVTRVPVRVETEIADEWAK